MSGLVRTHRVYKEEDIPAEVYEALTLPNPDFISAMKRGASVRGIPTHINMWHEKDGLVYIPRNLDPDLLRLLPYCTDKMVDGHKVDIEFKSSLREYQNPAVEDLSKSTGGILQAGCGTGKTVMSLASIANVGRTTLILVHKEFLQNQWVERIKEHLGYDAGIVRGDTWDWEGKKIVVGMLQTLYSRRESIPDGFLEYFGLIVSDEVHRVAADTWSYVVTMFPARRRWGLTATVNRSDGLQEVFLSHIGPVIHQLKADELKPNVVRIDYYEQMNLDEFKQYNGEIHISKLVTGLCKLPRRNKLILNLAAQAVQKGRKIIVFSERVKHLEELNKDFNELAKNTDYTSGLYIGKMNQDERDEVAEECNVLFATYHIAKEALDIPELDTAIFASPVSNAITIQQGTGRITRLHATKREPLVLDIVDTGVEICMRQFYKRVNIYGDLGYPIHTN